MLVMVDNVRKMTMKKSCRCGEYGFIEHLLFLVFFFSVTQFLLDMD